MPLQGVAAAPLGGGHIHYHWPIALEDRLLRRAHSMPAGDLAPIMREDQEVRQLLQPLRQAPAAAVDPRLGELDERRACRRPQRQTRQRLDGLPLEDLARLLREHGLPRLGSPEDRRTAERALPLPEWSAAEGGPLRVPRVDGFLERCTWSELVNTLQDTARRHLQVLRGLGEETPEALREVRAWEYFESVCDSLFRARLRGSGAAAVPETDSSSWPGDIGNNSLVAWRVGSLCAELGLLAHWEEVLRRLGRGSTLFLTALPVPHLSDELQVVTRLVPSYTVMSAVVQTSANLEVPLWGCDVLYVAGEHGRGLPGLRFAHVPRMPLAVLNICRSEALGRRLLSSGVQHVVCWPAEVHDHEATEFGIALVRRLFEDNIAEAFSKAVAGVCLAERAPRLLVQPSQIPQSLGAGTRGVVLAAKYQSNSGPLKYAGKTAQVLFHTAANGWVRVNVGGSIISWRMGHWHHSGGPAVQARRAPVLAQTHVRAPVVLVQDGRRPRLRRGFAYESLDDIFAGGGGLASGGGAPHLVPVAASRVCTGFSVPAGSKLRRALHFEAAEEGEMHRGRGVVLVTAQPKPPRRRWRGLVIVQPKPRRPRWIKGLFSREVLTA